MKNSREYMEEQESRLEEIKESGEKESRGCTASFKSKEEFIEFMKEDIFRFFLDHVEDMVMGSSKEYPMQIGFKASIYRYEEKEKTIKPDIEDDLFGILDEEDIYPIS